MEWDLDTDNWILNAGTKAVLKIEIENLGDAPNDSFTMAWADESEVFTIKAIPDDSGNELPESGILTLAQFADLLRDEMEKNYPLSNDFVLTRSSAGGEFIIFTAREVGADYDITLTEALAWMTEDSSTAGVDASNETNMEIILQVWGEDSYKSGDFEKLVELAKTPDSNSNVVFDVAEIIEPLLGEDLPTYNQAAITRCDNVIKRFYGRYGERYGTTLTFNEIVTDDAGGAYYSGVNGGSGFQFFNDNPDLLTYLGTDNFLTFQPDNKEISEAQHEYLYWCATAGYASIEAHLDIYFTDGTNILDTTYLTKATIFKTEIYIVPISHNKIAALLVIPAGKTIDYFKVWMVDGGAGTAITNKRTYYIDRKQYIENTYLLYRNSLGAFETLWCKGEIEQGIEVKREELEQIIDSDYAATDKEIVEYETNSQDPETIHTGWLNKTWARHMREVIFSSSRYKVGDAAYEAVLMRTDSFKFNKTTQHLYGLKLSIKPAYRNQGYQTTEDIPEAAPPG